jgi:hypothetical protein
LRRIALPIVAIVTFALIGGTVVAAAAGAGTHGFAFAAYHVAANHLLTGQDVYDTAVEHTGGYGFFYYPPPFIFGALPFALVPLSTAVWMWLGLSVALLLAGIWLMPVGRTVRWATLLLAGVSWPTVYALKLGQVGPLLLFLFVVGWRWMDSPTRLGVAGAIGAIVKIQPGIVLAWALLTRRFRAVVIGGAVLVAAAVAATIAFGGLSVWGEYLTILRTVSDPITTPHNFTPGAVAYQAGVSAGLASVLQIGSTLALIVACLAAVVWLPNEVSYLIAVVASQLLSPVLWDHYAMLLLVPVAWLLNRRAWWALAIPLATSAATLLVSLPPVIYPVTFWATIVGLAWVGLRETDGLRRTGASFRLRSA